MLLVLIHFSLAWMSEWIKQLFSVHECIPPLISQICEDHFLHRLRYLFPSKFITNDSNQETGYVVDPINNWRSMVGKRDFF